MAFGRWTYRELLAMRRRSKGFRDLLSGSACGRESRLWDCARKREASVVKRCQSRSRERRACADETEME